ncbi:monooxygenase [Laetiporus sulphureus 93-53]|uniref:Monooxygenase n=1 Tax=Laetiporus sulphureus 93-53 TaxID=1314785 RepID=A0A165ER49_9APHY|nr:monooxygenase [Laetiporus sulphureus 93-53]KZT07593.1 monooxygenase [Laetiporus sulphureus 93-53]
MSAITHLSVLIVGAGPTGLVLALTLAQNGIPIRIIEKDIKYHVGQRGAGIQPRTLEVFKLLGVLPDVLEKGIPLLPINTYKLPGDVEVKTTTRLVPELEPTPSEPYINPWTLGQANTEAILRNHLKRIGHRVELGTELRDFEQRADYITAHIAREDGGQESIEIVTCHWLVGADGGKSTVRRQLGLTFLGESLATEIIIGDVEVGGVDYDHWHVWRGPLMPMVSLRPTEEKGLCAFSVSGQVDYEKIMVDDEELFKAIRKGSDRGDLRFGTVRWKSNYRPASASLLSTFTEERLPVIKFMIEETSSLFRQTFMKASENKDGWQRRDHMRQLGVNYRWSSIVLDERTPASAPDAVKEPVDVYGINSDGVPRAGDRAPDAPGLVDVQSRDVDSQPTSLFDTFSLTRHTVLIFSPDDTEAGLVLEAVRSYPRDLVRSVVVCPRHALATSSIGGADLALIDRDGHAYSTYAVETDAFTIVVVRPDGVIGAIATSVEGVKKYFRDVFLRWTEVEDNHWMKELLLRQK